MKLTTCIFLIISLLGLDYCLGQPTPPIIQPINPRDYISPSNPRVKKHAKYKRNLWKFVYDVKMIDGNALKANSEIFVDKQLNRHFIYHTSDNSTRKIFPEETISLTKPNPYKKQDLITGIPVGNKWQFKVLSGQINAYCSFVDGFKITEIQKSNGQIIEANTESMNSAVGNLKKAREAVSKNDYYAAIRLYNKKHKE